LLEILDVEMDLEYIKLELICQIKDDLGWPDNSDFLLEEYIRMIKND